MKIKEIQCSRRFSEIKLYQYDVKQYMMEIQLNDEGLIEISTSFLEKIRDLIKLFKSISGMWALKKRTHGRRFFDDDEEEIFF